MRYTVTTPVKGYSGRVAGVDLVNGEYVGELAPQALAYFREAGYDVQPHDQPTEPEPPHDPPAGPDGPEGTPNPEPTPDPEQPAEQGDPEPTPDPEQPAEQGDAKPDAAPAKRRR